MRLKLALAAAVLAAAYLLFFHGLADRDLWSSHEARAAMDGQSVLRGHFLLPQLSSGEPEFQKPPLYYWLVALFAWPRGEVDAWAVRLPAALSALGLVLLLWRAGGGRVGLLAAAILGTAVHFTWLARIGRIDMPLTLTTAVAVVGFSRGTRGWLVAAYLSLAAGVMLKGPIGLVLPVAVLIAHRASDWLFSREPPASATLHGGLTPRRSQDSARRRLAAKRGLALVALLVLPWFVWVNVATDGEQFRVFFWYHNVTRGLGGSDLRGHPSWFYPATFAGDFLPWSPLLVPAVYLSWRNGWWRSDPVARLGLVWFVVVLVVLSCARFKRADYLLPAYPGAALFLAATLDRWVRSLRPRLAWGTALAFALIAVGAVGGWVYRVEVGLPAEEPFRDYRAFAALVREESGDAPTVFFRTEAHPLAFRLGTPVVVCRYPEEVEALLAQHNKVCVVLEPKAEAALPDVPREAVARNTDLAGGSHERPLVLVRLHQSGKRLRAGAPALAGDSPPAIP